MLLKSRLRQKLSRYLLSKPVLLKIRHLSSIDNSQHADGQES